MPTINNPIDVGMDVLTERLNSALGFKELKGKQAARSALERMGAGVDDAAQVITDIMKGSQDESLRMKAAEKVMQIHGAMDDEKVAGDFNIQINFSSYGNKEDVTTLNVKGILQPPRMFNDVESSPG